MKKIIFTFGLLLAFLIGISPVLINAWVGSNPSLGISYPIDFDKVAYPFTVRGWCWNTTQGIDYYKLWLIEDTYTDTETYYEGTFGSYFAPTTPDNIYVNMVEDLVPIPVPAGYGTIGWTLEITSGDRSGTKGYILGAWNNLYDGKDAFLLTNGTEIAGASVGDTFKIWRDVGSGTISQTEFDSRVTVHIQEDFNIEKYNLPLTPRYLVDDTFVESGKSYFMFIYGVDLNGDVSADTNLVGLTWAGDSTRTESMLRYFKVTGYRP